MRADDRTVAALQGFASYFDALPCPYFGSSAAAAWHLGRIRAELGEAPPRRVRLLDGSHLLADGQAYQFQEIEGFIALIPVRLFNAPAAHLAWENAKCRRSRPI